MKKLSILGAHNIVAIAIVGVLFVVAYFSNSTGFKASEVQAGTSQNVSGFAWSENIGWISLNSLDCDTDGNGKTDSGACGGDNSTTIAHDYGVNVDTATGAFSGKAWSENIGWISFDSADLTGCPSGTCSAQVDWSTGKVTGWARALSGTEGSGGFDGWISLSGNATDGSPYGVTITDGKFSGYAWGDVVIGWVDFAPSVSGSPITSNPQISVDVIPETQCTASDPTTFTWPTPAVCNATCVSGGGTTQTNVEGIETALCNDLSVPAPTRSCTVASLDCSTFVRDNPETVIYIIGDTICSSPNETFSNSPSDCANSAKTHFWQF